MSPLNRKAQAPGAIDCFNMDMRTPITTALVLFSLISPIHAQRVRTPVRVGPLRSAVYSPMGVQPRMTGSLSPSIHAPVLTPAAGISLPSPAVAPVPVSETQAVESPTPTPQQSLERSSELLREASGDASGVQLGSALQQIYSGSRRSDGPAIAAESVVNDEGVEVFGRAAEYYREVRRVVEAVKDKIDLSESLDVMDDSYADVWTKLKAIEALAGERGVERENTHLEETLTWVDGVLKEKGRNTAIHTHRVYFHKANNPASEYEEGIRRVDGFIRHSESYFKRGGQAERALGRLDEVVLVFDTRGYDQIKTHLKIQSQEASRRSGGRLKFRYLDEMTAIPKTADETRAGLNKLTKKYKGKGLEKIIEGVVYSRYVGLLLELKTLEHYLAEGYTILQSGRELFDEKGLYITELDTVVRSPEGKVLLVEAKSARVKLNPNEVLRDKVERKLATYAKHRQLLEAGVGRKLDGVVFSIDVGPNEDLIPFLEAKRKSLSSRYGFPVTFLFLESTPAH